MDDVPDWNLRTRPGLQMAKEENGYTTLTFERKLETCDDQDVHITVRCGIDVELIVELFELLRFQSMLRLFSYMVLCRQLCFLRWILLNYGVFCN